MSRKLLPLLDRVLVKRIKVAKDSSIAGVLIPETAAKENPQAEVIAVGPGLESRKMFLQVGDKVLLPDYKGQNVQFQGEKYDLYREDEIVGIVKE